MPIILETAGSGAGSGLTRAAYRTKLINKLRDVANNLGKTVFSTVELNEMLDNAPRRVFPHMYKLAESGALASDSKGRIDVSAESFTADKVTRIWDTDDEPVHGWWPRGTTKVLGLNESESGYVLQHIAPYVMPADDVTATDWPTQFEEMVVLAAALDGVERLAQDRVDYKGYQPSGESGVDENEILNLHDTLSRALEREIETKGLMLPSFGV